MRKAVRALVGLGVSAAVIAGAYVAGVAAAPDPADSGVDRPSSPSSVRPAPDDQRARQVDGDVPDGLTGDDGVEQQASDQEAPVVRPDRNPRGQQPARRSPAPEPTRETTAEAPRQTAQPEPEPPEVEPSVAPEPEPSVDPEPEPTTEPEPTQSEPEPTETSSEGPDGERGPSAQSTSA